jgi:uridine kinase
LRRLCATGTAEVPVYELAKDGRTGWQTLTVEGGLFVAEGIFAQYVVGPMRSEGHLAAAYCITQRPVVTFWRRLLRDLEERRKPPLVLVRRGLALMRGQRAVVAECVARGCTVATGHEAYRQLSHRLR